MSRRLHTFIPTLWDKGLEGAAVSQGHVLFLTFLSPTPLYPVHLSEQIPV